MAHGLIEHPADGLLAPRLLALVLSSGGTFLTQQVGGRDLEELNRALGAPPHLPSMDPCRCDGRAGGGREELLPAVFYDIGAVALFLRITLWQIPGFDLAGYDDALRALHRMMESGTPLKINSHRFLITARST